MNINLEDKIDNYFDKSIMSKTWCNTIFQFIKIYYYFLKFKNL